MTVGPGHVDGADDSAQRLTMRRYISVGRTDDCQSCLQDPSAARYHLQISVRDGKFYWKARDTTNGTLLNGRPMREVHEPMAITDHHFDLVAQHLVATLKWAGVCEDDVNEVVAIVGPLKKQIVTA